jgi:hypothetical protein
MVFSQKHYEFDYLVTYQSISLDSTKNISKQFLTNSKNNNYFAVITEKSDSENILHFHDRHGLHFNVFFKKETLIYCYREYIFENKIEAQNSNTNTVT